MKTFASIAVLLLVLGLPVAAAAGAFDAILYKDPACGCCLNYVAYLEGAGPRRLKGHHCFLSFGERSIGGTNLDFADFSAFGFECHGHGFQKPP